MKVNQLKLEIEKAWDKKKEIWSTNNCIRKIVIHVIDYVEQGSIRVSEFINGKWRVNEWIKKAIIMYFSIKKMKTIELGPLEFYDKIPIKNKFKEKGIRVVPHAVVRYGSYISPGVVLMPSYVNIGSYIGEETMIDTWATVGSCAQVGKRVHISGGVGIGGVLEPIQATPVIIEDDVFIGSRCILVEGVLIEKESVLGANVVITSSTKIFDVTNEKPIEMKGVVPRYSVVIPGSYPKKFPSGIYHIPCAMIIGKRKVSTNKKTSLNEALRTHHLVL
ncbi:2,3,4,5-tetrahydropyridine-2,6-dicarboxylate N-succinyltransferase [Blattabacterium sp. (Cryptocercus kyebangensis)]|uniref:2,3,4,5-tetrahydropyridine-2,6-dicarboxylate N-succinyltransferase n=1 Tax=Blattabacterium sp. (Cryptocercus kyebangensis) TaxID=298656 RepID=UPI000D7C1D68|nr:2,3,4,5-tetrahydropyridine-2,6-dicarboxylate N-succinyltransferase [Blattabacterium sp. (Cryptocercus kyebangensis)]AWU43852.1 2,3,4,5-tetrahydropyridine-2,6-dicarboxylate N-succinyltransferase [Blattabacterium sp. (Cryptocercus kyebangensis)]